MQNKLPKVSIGVPVYNAAKYIERCACSIFMQNYEDLDIVFVDDCSVDNSVAILEETLKRFPQRKKQTQIIRLMKNQGVSVARNTLIDTFEGEFVVFVDADDFLTKNAIDLLISKQKEENSDMVTGKIIMKFSNFEKTIEEPRFNHPEEMMMHIVSQPANHYNWARLYRKSVIVDNKIRYKMGMHMGEDWLFLVSVVMHLKVISIINEIVYIYDCTNEESAMHRLANSQVFAKYMLMDLKTLHEIYKLIGNYGKDYINSLEKMMSQRIEKGLISACKAKDRNTFDLIKNYISLISPNNIEKKYLFHKLCFWGSIRPEYYIFYFAIKKVRDKLNGLLN